MVIFFKFCKLSLFWTSDNSNLWYSMFKISSLCRWSFTGYSLCKTATLLCKSYYSTSANIGRKDICCHCGVDGAEQYREDHTVIPICAGCKASGKEIIKRLKRKWK